MLSPVSHLHLCCGDVCSKTDNAIRSSNVFYGAKKRCEPKLDGTAVCVCVQQVIVLRMFFCCMSAVSFFPCGYLVGSEPLDDISRFSSLAVLG